MHDYLRLFSIRRFYGERSSFELDMAFTLDDIRLRGGKDECMITWDFSFRRSTSQTVSYERHDLYPR
jgi:hypothetical protein